MKILAYSILLLLRYSFLATAAAAAADDDAESTTGYRQATPDARIYNGDDAVQGRYPYSVSLQEASSLSHFCGGMLIAPDIVLSAAHCQFLPPSQMAIRINPHSLKIPVEESELFPVLEQVIHPAYSGATLVADFAVLKLDGISNSMPIRLNGDEAVPAVGQPIKVMGWGGLENGASVSDILQSLGSTFYVNQTVCNQLLSQDPNYVPGVTVAQDSMLCTVAAEGFGSCQGDSGGPVVISGASADEDLLVGLVSWGFECGAPTISSVDARVSWGYDFIRANVCRMSVNPPSSFGCTDSDRIQPSAMPTSSPAPTGEQVDILLQLFMDDYPTEIGWRLETSNGRVLYEKGPGAYLELYSVALEVISVDVEASYTLVLTDSYGDGNVSPMAVQVFLGNAVDPKQLLTSSAFVEAFEVRIPILVSVDSLQSEAPIFTPPPQALEPTATPSVYAAPTGSNLVDAVVFVKFDSKPMETSWTLKRLDGRLMAEGGSYSPFIGDSITESVSVEADQTYIFTMFDSNGLCCEYGFGEAYVYLGNEVPSIKTDNALAHNDGRFWGEKSDTFVVSQDAIIDFTMAPTVSPTVSLSPTISPRPTPIPTTWGWPISTPTPSKPSVPVSIVIWFDDAPAEVGWSIVRDGSIVIDILSGTYTSELSSKMVHTIVELEIDETYEMWFHDAGGDGYCCGKGQGNFTVYAGTELLESNILAADSGGSFSFESTQFVVPEDVGGAVAISASSSKPSGQMSILIWFDEYPSEVGWRLEKDGNTIMDVADGAYSFGLMSQSMQTIVELEIDGIYDVWLSDSAGDGYCCDYGTGNFTVYAGTELLESNILAADSGGSFRLESARFVVPAPPSPMPSSMPTIEPSGKPTMMPILMEPTIVQSFTSTTAPSLAVAQPSSSPNSAFTSLSTRLLLVSALVGAVLLHGVHGGIL